MVIPAQSKQITISVIVFFVFHVLLLFMSILMQMQTLKKKQAKKIKLKPNRIVTQKNPNS
jgi:amino acid permease